MFNIPFFAESFQASVWIIGNEITTAVQKRAAIRNFAKFRRLNVNISWFQFDGFCSPLSSFVSDIIVNFDPPDIIVLHIGADFIGRINTIRFIGQFQQELLNIQSICSSSLLIFSEIVSILAWTHGDFVFFDKICKRVNRGIHKFMPLVKGFSYRHMDLEGFLPGFYIENKVLLSPISLDLFNLGL